MVHEVIHKISFGCDTKIWELANDRSDIHDLLEYEFDENDQVTIC